MQKLSEYKMFGGRQLRYQHESDVLDCAMRFSVYLPTAVERHPVPVLYWLSGLTCTDENFVIKAGAQQFAEKYQIALVAPDTSPRGEGVADDPDGSWDFGLGAGFYLNATQAPFDRHYQMYDYVVDELRALINRSFPVEPEKTAISGHSMGGHGALTIALKNPDIYRSVSAFSPICSPMHCPWGQKALTGYLGKDVSQWRQYDAAALIRQAKTKLPMRVDQGSADEFLVEQLKPELLWQAAADAGFELDFRMQTGYDHSYFFIASFIEEHIGFHARYLDS